MSSAAANASVFTNASPCAKRKSSKAPRDAEPWNSVVRPSKSGIRPFELLSWRLFRLLRRIATVLRRPRARRAHEHLAAIGKRHVASVGALQRVILRLIVVNNQLRTPHRPVGVHLHQQVAREPSSQ